MKNDWPKCDHKHTVHRVTNFPDSVTSEQIREEHLPYRSAWVCERRSCVFEAMAWVERVQDATGEMRALVYNTDKELVTL